MVQQKILNVEQLNIVGKDGTPRLTLFNEDHIPPLLFQGKDILPGHRQNDAISGMMFYNQDGTECGGLIFGNDKDENGQVTAGMSLTIDQFQQDQVVQLLFNQQNEQKQYGLYIYDRPTTPIDEQLEKHLQIQQANLTEDEKNQQLDRLYEDSGLRAFLGKSGEHIAVQLFDKQQQPRLKMYVDQDGNLHIDFLDAEGNITYSMPPQNEKQ